MEYEIRKIGSDRIDEALDLVSRVFMEFDAPDYSEDGIRNFQQYIIESEDFKEKFKTGDQIMKCAFVDDKIVGVIAISARNHISLLFVDIMFHKKGIAKALFNSILEEVSQKGKGKIKLKSSLYAKEFYLKLGFKSIDKEQYSNGIKYVPMEFNY